MPGPMIILVSGKTSISLLYMSTGKVAVTNRYCVMIGEESIKLCNATLKSSSLKSISTSSNTALQYKQLITAYFWHNYVLKLSYARSFDNNNNNKTTAFPSHYHGIDDAIFKEIQLTF